MAKLKKINEKIDNLKPIFEILNVEVSNEQMETFINQFELMKDNSIKEAVAPIEEKMKDYQRRNFELQAKLEEATQISNKFNKILEEKVSELNKLNFPKVENIEKLIDNKLKNIQESFSKKLVEFDKIDENIKKIESLGNIFNSNIKNFANVIVEKESSELKILREEIDSYKRENEQLLRKVDELNEDVLKEREATEVILLLENDNLDKQEKELLYKLFEKVGLKEAKSDIINFISKKEEKKREERTYSQRTIERTNGIKAVNDPGFIKPKKSLMNESVSLGDEMDEWVKLSGINKEK